MGDWFKVNGVYIKNPSTFKIERYNLTTLERLASGEMTGDLVAQKYKFYFTYEALTAAELENILNPIWYAKTLFFPLQYKYNGKRNTVTVYVGSIPTELARAGFGSDWVWKGVTFNLIEK